MIRIRYTDPGWYVAIVIRQESHHVLLFEFPSVDARVETQLAKFTEWKGVTREEARDAIRAHVSQQDALWYFTRVIDTTARLVRDLGVLPLSKFRHLQQPLNQLVEGGE